MTSSVIGSQIFNLQICLGVPWLMKTLFDGPIILTDKALFGSIMVVVLIVCITMLVIVSFKLRLTYGLGFCLMITYVFYAGFEYVQNS